MVVPVAAAAVDVGVEAGVGDRVEVEAEMKFPVGMAVEAKVETDVADMVGRMSASSEERTLVELLVKVEEETEVVATGVRELLVKVEEVVATGVRGLLVETERETGVAVTGVRELLVGVEEETEVVASGVRAWVGCVDVAGGMERRMVGLQPSVKHSSSGTQ